MSNNTASSANSIPLAKRPSLSSLKFKKKEKAQVTAPPAAQAPAPQLEPSHRKGPAPAPALPSRASQRTQSRSALPSSSSTPRQAEPAAQNKNKKPPVKVKVPQGFSAATRWGNDVVFAYDTDYIPSNPDGLWARGVVPSDGYWGRHEYTLYPQPFDVHAPQMALLELPTPDSKTWLEFFELERSHLDADALPAEYMLNARIHVKMRDMSWRYRGDFDDVARLIQEVCSKRALPEDSIEYDVASNMAIPKAMASNMTKRYGTLQAAQLREKTTSKIVVTERIKVTEEEKEKERMEAKEAKEKGLKFQPKPKKKKTVEEVEDSLVPALRSMGDMVACVRAWQRAALEVSAFIDMGATLLAKAKHPSAEAWLKRRERHDVSPRRGSILMGEDVPKYFHFLRGLRVPTYVRVPFEDVDVGPLRFVEPGPYRSSMSIDRTLTDVEHRDLPLAWYMPKNVPSHLVELVARGSLPLNQDYGCGDEEDKEPYQQSAMVLEKKRKSEAMEREAKRQRTAISQAEERRDAWFHHKHPKMGTSAETYRWFVKNAAPLRRFFDMKDKPRAPFLPAATQLYSEAEAALVNNLHLIAPAVREGEDSLATFVPPIHLIANAKPSRRARLLVNLILLLPILLARPALAQRNPNAGIRRLGVNDWKDVLRGVKFSKEDFWVDGKKGGELLFGQEYARLRAQPSERPAWGMLPCRNAPGNHEPTLELVENDDVLAASIMLSLHQWRLLHWLPHLAKPADLEYAGLKKISDKFGSHYTPDFMSTALDVKIEPPLPNALPGKKKKNQERKRKTVVGMIRQIVLLDRTINAQGWPTPWTTEIDDEKVRRKWLQNLAAFYARAAHADELDSLKIGSEEWAHTRSGLLTPNVQTWAKQDELERHLHLRYVLTSLKCGQMPVEFMVLPHGTLHQCRECRERDAREVRATYGAPGMTEAFNDYDLTDEGEDYY